MNVLQGIKDLFFQDPEPLPQSAEATGIWPFTGNPREWIDKSDPNYQPSIYTDRPTIDVTGSGMIKSVTGLKSTVSALSKLRGKVKKPKHGEYRIKRDDWPGGEKAGIIQKYDSKINDWKDVSGRTIPGNIDRARPYRITETAWEAAERRLEEFRAKDAGKLVDLHKEPEAIKKLRDIFKSVDDNPPKGKPEEDLQVLIKKVEDIIKGFKK